MKPITILALLAALTSTALGQSTTYYDSRGSVTGRSSTTGGTATFYDPRGNVVGSETRQTGNSSAIYDAQGRHVGSTITMPAPSFNRALGLR
jgi:YD repeat-containing protein